MRPKPSTQALSLRLPAPAGGGVVHHSDTPKTPKSDQHTTGGWGGQTRPPHQGYVLCPPTKTLPSGVLVTLGRIYRQAGTAPPPGTADYSRTADPYMPEMLISINNTDSPLASLHFLYGCFGVVYCSRAFIPHRFLRGGVTKVPCGIRTNEGYELSLYRRKISIGGDADGNTVDRMLGTLLLRSMQGMALAHPGTRQNACMFGVLARKREGEAGMRTRCLTLRLSPEEAFALRGKLVPIRPIDYDLHTFSLLRGLYGRLDRLIEQSHNKAVIQEVERLNVQKANPQTDESRVEKSRQADK